MHSERRLHILEGLQVLQLSRSGLLACVHAAALLLAAQAFGQNADCTFNPRQMMVSPPARWREISRRAEMVAPTVNKVSDRRRPSNPPLAPKNFIDDEIFGRMQRDGVKPTTPAGDEEFLRRVTVDLTGEIPKIDTVKAFLQDSSPVKREAAVDRLLSSDAFTDRWTMWLGDLVQNVFQSATSAEYIQGRKPLSGYLRQSIQSKKPYDAIVRDLISASGASFHDGRVVYWVRQVPSNVNDLPPQDTFDNVSASTGDQFLGMPFLCVSCHNGIGHLEQVNRGMSKRTRLEFWKNASFFAQTSWYRAPNEVTSVPETFLSDKTTGEYELNTTGGNKTPRAPTPDGQTTVSPAFFLTGETPRPGETRRQAYARILTANPQFARNAVNLLWKEMFGLGIVEPVNSFDPARQDPANLPAGLRLQPTHPQLLDKLAQAFVSSGYDLRAILRLMAVSNAYQLSSRYTPGPWDEAWVPYFARHYPRRLMSEALLDAIVRATGVEAKISEGPVLPIPPLVEPLVGIDAKAMQLPDPTGGKEYAPFLDRFGRGNRDNLARSSNPSIGQALSLLNSHIITDRVKASVSGSTVQKIIAATSDRGAMADQMYLVTLSRYPTTAERATAISALSGDDVVERLEDLQFALINSLEFLFN
jgi:uncharacterized protein DUF1553/uncharacterized protein DUF1549